MIEPFSSQWRPTQACSRCRYHKVRCEYATPESSRCKRCEKVDSDCAVFVPKRQKRTGENFTRKEEVNINDKRHALQNDSVEGRGKLEKRGSASSKSLFKTAQSAIVDLAQADNISTHERLTHLYDLITVAKENISTLDREKSLATGEWGYPVLNMDLIRSKDCVQTAIDQKLYTAEEAELYFQCFCQDMIHMACMGMKIVEYQTMKNKRPVLCLAMVTAAAIGTTLEKAEYRSSFLEKVLDDQALVQQVLTIELAQALMLNGFFVSLGNSFLKYSLVSGLTVAMDCGLMEDPEKLNKVCDKKLSEEEDAEAMENLELYTGIAVVLMAIVLHTTKRRTIDLVSHRMDVFVKLMESRKSTLSTSLLLNIEYLLLAQKSSDILERVEKCGEEEEILNLCFLGIDEVQENTERVFKDVPFGKDGTIEGEMMHMITMHLSSLFCEAGIQRLAPCLYLNHCDVWKSERFANMLAAAQGSASSMIEHFVMMSRSHKRFPKYFYSRPVRALLILIRMAQIKTKVLEVINSGPSSIDTLPAWNTFIAADYEKQILDNMETIEQIWSNIAKHNKMAAETFRFFHTLKGWYWGLSLKKTADSPKDGCYGNKLSTYMTAARGNGTDKYLMKGVINAVLGNKPNQPASAKGSGQSNESLPLDGLGTIGTGASTSDPLSDYEYAQGISSNYQIPDFWFPTNGNFPTVISNDWSYPDLFSSELVLPPSGQYLQ